MPNIITTISNYKLKYLRQDLTAALGVAAISLPQVMAFALLAGLNPIYGLYTFIVSNILFFITGSSNYMIVGPTNMVSVTIASSLNAIGAVTPDNYLQFVILLTFLVGAFQVVLGLIKIGNLVNYISDTVIIGITTGVSFIIISGQLENLLEIEIPAGSGNVISNILNLINNIEQTNFYGLAMGIFTIIAVLLCKKYFPRLPSYLAGVIAAIILVIIFDLHQYLVIIGSIDASLPPLRIPRFDLQAFRILSSSALSIAILGFTQVLSIVKIMEEKTGEVTDLNREFISQGFINMSGSFFSSFAITGSFSRSFTNVELGGKTRFTALMASMTVLISVILFSRLVSLIPISSLAAVVILVAVSMLDIEEILKCFSTTRADAITFLVTFTTTVLTPRLDFAIYVGVIVSAVIVLRNTSDINYSHLSLEEEEEEVFTEEEDIEEVKEDDYIVINLSGTLHYNTAENLKEELTQSYLPEKVFVIRLRRVEDIDLTAVKELEKFVDRVQENGGEVILAGLDQQKREIFEQAGLLQKIGEENYYTEKENIFSSTKKAIEKAEEKVNNDE